MQTDTTPDGYRRDGKGNLTLEANIKPLDRLRDEFVNGLIGKVRLQNAALARLKENTFSEFDAFIELSFAEYGASMGGKKGNVTLYNFDHSCKVEVAVMEHIAFDERLQAAKSLIDACIREWGIDAHPGLMALINDAFQVDKTGKVSTARVLGLRRHDIQDEKWQRAMLAISDSIQSVGSKRYMRFYARIGNTDEYAPISLDIAKL